ncbi:MAG: nodulation protein NfeD [Candidatus Glassbacteria bacterium]
MVDRIAFRIVRCLLPASLLIWPTVWASAQTVYVTKVDAIINPVVAKYLGKTIEKAEEEGAECLIIELDTPGGLDLSMREIVKRMLSADVPVCVFVYPAGSRAASAGVWITLASHIAAMAPGTNIGAAHPVMMGIGAPQEEDSTETKSTMEEKIVNDAVAHIRSIAEKRERNADWAEKAVRKSVSITADEALEEGVIEYICENIDCLLKAIDGLEVDIASGKKTLSTSEATITRVEMNLRYRLLNVISNPSIAYILLMLGIYGIFFELSNPGSILPGVVGGIFIILAFFSLQMLPINYAGLLLILLAIILFIAEIKITSYGLLTVGGAVSMILGSIMLIDTPVPFLRISWTVIVPAVIITILFFLFAVGMGLRAQRRKPVSGKEATIGGIGVAKTELDPNGQVFLDGELWRAHSEHPIRKGEKVRVIRLSHMQLEVESAEQPEEKR